MHQYQFLGPDQAALCFFFLPCFFLLAFLSFFALGELVSLCAGAPALGAAVGVFAEAGEGAAWVLAAAGIVGAAGAAATLEAGCFCVTMGMLGVVCMF